MVKEYTHKSMKLTGIMIEDMIKKLEIPMENTTLHGVVKIADQTFTLYKVPAPYDQIDVFYGSYWDVNDIIPNYYFTRQAINEFNLTPIVENEKRKMVCRWTSRGRECVAEYHFLYNRKNEEKYRLRFLTDPNFDPADWEQFKVLEELFKIN